MSRLSVDIETYSSVNIKKSGLYKYVQASDFPSTLIRVQSRWETCAGSGSCSRRADSAAHHTSHV